MLLAMTRSRVSLPRVEAAAKHINPLFLHSPQFISAPLSEALGVRVALKIETVNPIRCFKGRGADWLVSQLETIEPLVCASVGNFGQAMAYACRQRQFPLRVYASEQANAQKIASMRALAAEVVLHGQDFDAAKHEAKRYAQAQGYRFVEDGRDLATLEGAATIGLEWLNMPESLDALFIPLGNGALFNGIATVMKAKRPQLRMVAVQAQQAPAMLQSWRAGRLLETPHANTIADGIAIRVPIPEALEDLQQHVDDALLVSEASIVEAMRLLHRHVGIVVEPAGAVGIAALLEHGEAWRGQTIGTVLCGSNISEAMQAWLC